MLSAESEADMRDWTDGLTRVLHAEKTALRDAGQGGEGGLGAPVRALLLGRSC